MRKTIKHWHALSVLDLTFSPGGRGQRRTFMHSCSFLTRLNKIAIQGTRAITAKRVEYYQHFTCTNLSVTRPHEIFFFYFCYFYGYTFISVMFLILRVVHVERRPRMCPRQVATRFAHLRHSSTTRGTNRCRYLLTRWHCVRDESHRQL